MSGTPNSILRRIREAQKQQLKELDLSRFYFRNDPPLTSIPTEIFELTQLENLVLSGHEIKVLPAAIGRLRNLRILDLSHNRLTRITSTIGELRNLTRLELTADFHLKPRLIGDLYRKPQLPESMAQLRNITSLGLDGFNLSTFPGWITELRNLTRLSLTWTNISILPVRIGQLQNLTSLNLCGNSFKGVPNALACLRHLTGLEYLHLGYNDLENISDIMSHLVNTNIVELHLPSNGLALLPDTVDDLRNLHFLI
jgi:Leucine-rich repeat (LRR) protein